MKAAWLAALPLLLQAAAAPPEPSPVQRLGPYVETREDGSYVDWLEGVASVTGRARIKVQLTNPTFYRMTKRAAEDEARPRLLKSLGDVSIDGAARLRDRPDLMERITKAAEDMEAAEVRTGRGMFMQAVMKIPLWGDSGVVQLVLPKAQHPIDPGATRTASPSATPTAPTPADPVTGLVIDARDLQEESRPLTALLPRVLDTKGRIIYSAERVDQRAAQERGLIAYATSVEETYGPHEEAEKPPRQGSSPMVVPAAGSGGAGKADILVSVEDADRILEAASGSPFLKECRVIVLMPPPSPPQAGRPAAPRRPAPAQPSRPSLPEKP